MASQLATRSQPNSEGNCVAAILGSVVIGLSACLDASEGANPIPIMTVHKSKWLEYDTIIFVGLRPDKRILDWGPNVGEKGDAHCRSER